jgi:hypothetical protein
MKNPVTPSGIETTTFHLAAQCINQHSPSHFFKTSQELLYGKIITVCS